jgi:hypothetical protein
MCHKLAKSINKIAIKPLALIFGPVDLYMHLHLSVLSLQYISVDAIFCGVEVQTSFRQEFTLGSHSFPPNSERLRIALPSFWSGLFTEEAYL